jgi:hypothetical protein
MTVHTRPCHTVPPKNDPRLAVKVGDRVRSFDFPSFWGFRPAAWEGLGSLDEETTHATGLCVDGPHACYREGVLTGIDDGHYTIAVDCLVWEGVREAADGTVRPPVNGRETLRGWTFGVHAIAAEEPAPEPAEEPAPEPAKKFDRCAVLDAISEAEVSEKVVEAALRTLNGGEEPRSGFIDDLTPAGIRCEAYDALPALRTLVADARANRARGLYCELSFDNYKAPEWNRTRLQRVTALERQVRCEMAAEVKALRVRASRLAKALRA